MLNILKYLRDRLTNSSKSDKKPTPINIDDLKGYTDEEMFGLEKNPKKIIEDFEKASKYLAVRIYHQELIDNFKLEELVHRTDLEGTVTVLVLDLPASVECILHTNIDRWSKTPEELFPIALNNLKEKFKREVENDGNHFLKLTGRDVFVTSEALFFERNHKCIGKYGAIFCLPNRDTFRAAAINSDIDLEIALQYMIPFAEDTYDSSEDRAITNHIFWHFEGKNELIYTYYGLNRLRYVLPQDLADMVY